MQYNQTLTYVNVLKDIVENYNNTIHNFIYQKLLNVFQNCDYFIISLLIHNNQQKNNKKNYFKIGDYVRFLKVRKIFNKKSFKTIYSTNFYKIIGIRGNQYLLDNKRYYYGEQLIKGTSKDNNFDKLQLINNKQNKEKRELKQEF
jgi:hypothetical protein